MAEHTIFINNKHWGKKKLETIYSDYKRYTLILPNIEKYKDYQGYVCYFSGYFVVKAEHDIPTIISIMDDNSFIFEKEIKENGKKFKRLVLSGEELISIYDEFRDQEEITILSCAEWNHIKSVPIYKRNQELLCYTSGCWAFPIDDLKNKKNINSHKLLGYLKKEDLPKYIDSIKKIEEQNDYINSIKSDIKKVEEKLNSKYDNTLSEIVEINKYLLNQALNYLEKELEKKETDLRQDKNVETIKSLVYYKTVKN